MQKTKKLTCARVPLRVEALQLNRENWNEMCQWLREKIDVKNKEDLWILLHGYDPDAHIDEGRKLLVINEGDWVTIAEDTGSLKIYSEGDRFFNDFEIVPITR